MNWLKKVNYLETTDTSNSVKKLENTRSLSL